MSDKYINRLRKFEAPDIEDDVEEIGFEDRNGVVHSIHCKRSVNAVAFPRSPFLHTEPCTCGALDEAIQKKEEELKRLSDQIEAQHQQILKFNEQLPAHAPVAAARQNVPAIATFSRPLQVPAPSAPIDGPTIDAVMLVPASPQTGDNFNKIMENVTDKDVTPSPATVDSAEPEPKREEFLTQRDLCRLQHLLVTAGIRTGINFDKIIKTIRDKSAVPFLSEDRAFLLSLQEALDKVPDALSFASHYRHLVKEVLADLDASPYKPTTAFESVNLLKELVDSRR
jgi:hypothetical protein